MAVTFCSLIVSDQDKTDVQKHLDGKGTGFSKAVMNIPGGKFSGSCSAQQVLSRDIGENKTNLLMSPREFSLALLQSKISSNTFEDLTSFVGQGDCMYDKGDRILHSLLHIATDDCQRFTMQFASQYVCEQLLEQDGKFNEVCSYCVVHVIQSMWMRTDQV